MVIRLVRLNVVSETPTPICKNLYKMADINNIRNYFTSEVNICIPDENLHPKVVCGKQSNSLELVSLRDTTFQQVSQHTTKVTHYDIYDI